MCGVTGCFCTRWHGIYHHSGSPTQGLGGPMAGEDLQRGRACGHSEHWGIEGEPLVSFTGAMPGCSASTLRIKPPRHHAVGLAE